MKNYSKSSDICVFSLSKKRAELTAEKLIVGRGKMPNP